MSIERVSIEISTRCAKACWFCYSHSGPEGGTRWSTDDLVALVRDCAANGVKAVSFGGGEPLEHAPLFEILARLRGALFRSFTTNGLLLDSLASRVIEAAPDKVHVSIHFPERAAEVDRIARQVEELRSAGIRSGVNLLVRRSRLEAARAAVAALGERGIGLDRIVLLPMRGAASRDDTPTPRDIAHVAGGQRFQSMTCLAACAKSPRFASIAADRTAAWCSYTAARVPLRGPSFAALAAALQHLDLTYCGEPDERSDRLVRLSRRPLDGHDVVRGRP
ncbi:MAG: radical SAM protein [Deltaproteobacteria bacterium]|nr:radical SAM protein [Deltaproteobacteria bacterium]